jgi:hypothetical protein
MNEEDDLLFDLRPDDSEPESPEETSTFEAPRQDH